MTQALGEKLATVIIDPKTGKYFDQRSGTRLFRAPCPEHGTHCNDPSTCTQQRCPHCRTNWSSRSDDEEDDGWDLEIQPLRGAERLAVGVVAETALFGMPVYPGVSREWKPGKARRLLCFSDSRREAARLGPLLTRQHEVQVVRSAIVDTLANVKLPPEEYVKGKIAAYKEEAANLTLPPGIREEARRQIEYFEELLSYGTQGVPVVRFAGKMSRSSRIGELLERGLAERHGSEWRQRDWEENKERVARHTEALLATEMDSPLRTAPSVEAAGLVELVFPGIESMGLSPTFAGGLPNDQVRRKLAEVWPTLLAALDTMRADRAVDWSGGAEGRTWSFVRTMEHSPRQWMDRSQVRWRRYPTERGSFSTSSLVCPQGLASRRVPRNVRPSIA